MTEALAELDNVRAVRQRMRGMRMTQPVGAREREGSDDSGGKGGGERYEAGEPYAARILTPSHGSDGRNRQAPSQHDARRRLRRSYWSGP